MARSDYCALRRVPAGRGTECGARRRALSLRVIVLLWFSRLLLALLLLGL